MWVAMNVVIYGIDRYVDWTAVAVLSPMIMYVSSGFVSMVCKYLKIAVMDELVKKPFEVWDVTIQSGMSQYSSFRKRATMNLPTCIARCL